MYMHTQLRRVLQSLVSARRFTNRQMRRSFPGAIPAAFLCSRGRSGAAGLGYAAAWLADEMRVKGEVRRGRG